MELDTVEPFLPHHGLQLGATVEQGSEYLLVGHISQMSISDERSNPINATWLEPGQASAKAGTMRREMF
jgi:hypothetical protein